AGAFGREPAAASRETSDTNANESIQRSETMATTKQPARRDVKAIAREVSAEHDPESPVVQSLQTQTANAIVLYLNYKHYHWQTFGPLFRDLHKLFDRFAEDVLETLDPIAERVRMIGT